jgi:citrate lyase beta subunit
MLLRSVVRIPAGASIEPALACPADAVLLTVADAGHAVGDLREAALYALPRIRQAGKIAVVEVNHPRTQLLRGDLEAVVTEDLGAVFLTHTVEPQDVRDLAVLLREFEYNRGIEPGAVRAFPVIDSARGLLRAAEVVHAVPRVAGLVFASEHYAIDTGARLEERGERLAYARGAVVAAARAFDALPLVEASGLEATNLGQWGFAGIILPDARSVLQANIAFGPTPSEIARAKAHLAAYDAARASGGWVGRYGTSVIDSHAVRKAQQVLQAEEQAGEEAE